MEAFPHVVEIQVFNVRYSISRKMENIPSQKIFNHLGCIFGAIVFGFDRAELVTLPDRGMQGSRT